MDKIKQLQIALLTEKLSQLTGKRVMLESEMEKTRLGLGGSTTIFKYKGLEYILSPGATPNGEFAGYALAVKDPVSRNVVGFLSKNVSGSKWEGDLETTAEKLIHDFAD